MKKAFTPGDKVTWRTSQAKTHGTILKRQTSPTRIKGHDVKASESNPEYIVKSAKSGRRAAHKPDQLHKAH